ncbi:MAG TPA: DUF1015 domain-containing protein [Thermodesulfobacteriota bacterium]|nr:DUF1015 domain-containing protein [Thermodesulfobacteriota bacterium]
MAEIIPFRGFLYDISRVSIEDVLAPPYDIITPEERESLYTKSPHNIVRIDFGKEETGDNETKNKYTRAKECLDVWIRDGILIRSQKPSFYAYEVTYTIQDVQKRLRGFLCLLKLEELGYGCVYPHEDTHSKPKEDRLNLLRTCRASTSPIFSLYKSSTDGISNILSRIAQTKPYLQTTDPSGNLHRLWQFDEAEDIEVVRRELEDKAIFIADGHHRYETSLEYAREMSLKKASPSDGRLYDYTLAFLADMTDEGVTILPTHRLVKEIPEGMDGALSKYFESETIANDFDIRRRLSGRKNVFGFFRKREKMWHLLTYKGRNLSKVHPDLREIDVIILDEMIFKRILTNVEIGYEMDIAKALDQVNDGKYAAAFFLNPTQVNDIEKSALSSTRMPAKSTYFYPKLLTGLVVNKWE